MDACTIAVGAPGHRAHRRAQSLFHGGRRVIACALFLLFLGGLIAQEVFALVSDFNGNGKVDFDDFFLFASAFGKKQGNRDFDARFDLNKDGSVDFDDFLAFAGDFGKTGDDLASGPKPLTELGGDKYKGVEGGLYPDGRNDRPPAHEAVGLSLSRAVQPLDAEGKAAAGGKIVLLSVGMSNTTQEFSEFKRIADPDPEKNPNLVIVDGAGKALAKAW
jgi:hypothetical protein